MARISPGFRLAALFAAAALAGTLPATAQERVFQRIDIRGIQLLDEGDIRAACGIAEGAGYSNQDLRDVQVCLQSTGMFNSVFVNVSGDTLTLTLDEIMDRPGRAEVGIEVDSNDGLAGTFYIERFNLFPRTFGALELKFSREFASVEGNLYHNQAFGPNFDLGLDVTAQDLRYRDQSYQQRRITIDPYVAWRMTPDSRLELGLGWRSDDMRKLSPGASALFVAEQGRVDAPFLRLSYRWQSPDTVAGGPRFSFAANQFLWGLGTDDTVAETQLAAAARHELAPGRLDLVASVRAGQARAMGSNPATRAVDRFFPGGAEFRGFAPRGIGPRDGTEFVGGNRYVVVSAELQTPLGEVWGSELRGGVFADIGSVWGLDDTLGGAIDARRHLRSSLGVSLTFHVGTAPVSLYLARPVEKVTGDRSQIFGLSVSTPF